MPALLLFVVLGLVPPLCLTQEVGLGWAGLMVFLLPFFPPWELFHALAVENPAPCVSPLLSPSLILKFSGQIWEALVALSTHFTVDYRQCCRVLLLILSVLLPLWLLRTPCSLSKWQ